MFSIPSAQLTGIVTEKRALIAKKDQGNADAKPWAYIVKLLCMGGAYEIRCKNADVYNSAGEGQPISRRSLSRRIDQLHLPGAVLLLLAAKDEPSGLSDLTLDSQYFKGEYDLHQATHFSFVVDLSWFQSRCEVGRAVS